MSTNEPILTVGEVVIDEDVDGRLILRPVDSSGIVLAEDIDVDGNDISNVGALDASEATVATAPTDAEDAARKTETDAVQSDVDDHTGNTSNPHGTTLEQVRAAANILAGNVDFDGNAIAALASIGVSGSALGVDAPVDGVDPADPTHLTTKQYVDSVVQGLDWKESVLNEQNDPPGSPSDGDRYLINGAPTGDWSGHPEEIAEWDGSAGSWIFTVGDDGSAVFVEGAERLRVYYDGDGWIDFGSAIAHSALQGLDADDHPLYLPADGSRPMEVALPMDDNGIDDVGAVSETETTTADAGSSYDVDLSAGAVHKITLTADCTISFSGTDASAANSATLVVEQDGTGGHAVTWPSGVLWPEGDDPTVSSSADAIDRYAFTHIDGDWYGSEAGAGFE